MSLNNIIFKISETFGRTFNNGSRTVSPTPWVILLGLLHLMGQSHPPWWTMEHNSSNYAILRRRTVWRCTVRRVAPPRRTISISSSSSSKWSRSIIPRRCRSCRCPLLASRVFSRGSWWKENAAGGVGAARKSPRTVCSVNQRLMIDCKFDYSTINQSMEEWDSDVLLVMLFCISYLSIFTAYDVFFWILFFSLHTSGLYKNVYQVIPLESTSTVFVLWRHPLLYSSFLSFCECFLHFHLCAFFIGHTRVRSRISAAGRAVAGSLPAQTNWPATFASIQVCISVDG